VARIDEKSFFAYYIDYDRHEDVTGIFTAME
jgi:hypothetical protein